MAIRTIGKYCKGCGVYVSLALLVSHEEDVEWQHQLS